MRQAEDDTANTREHNKVLQQERERLFIQAAESKVRKQRWVYDSNGHDVVMCSCILMESITCFHDIGAVHGA